MRQSSGSFDWWLERVHPADRERFAREVGDFLESGARETRFEYRFRRVAGDYVPVRDRVIVERRADGTPIRLLAMVEERLEGPTPEPWTRYRDLFHRSRDAVVIVDSRGRIEDFNPAFLDLLSVPADAVRDRPMERFYRDPALREELVAELRGSGTLSDREIRLRGGEGQEVVVLASAVASFAADGAYLGHQAILHDVTARRHEEEEERRRARRLEERVGALGALYAVSERLARAERLDRETLTDIVGLVPRGLRFPELALASVVLGDLEVTDEGFDVGCALCAAVVDPSGEGPTGSVSVCYPDFPPVEGHSAFLQEEAEFLAEVAAHLSEAARRIHAVEARRREGAYHRTLVERSQDLLGILDTDGTIRYVSPAVAQLLGYEGETLVGRNALDLVHPDERVAAYRALEQAAESSDVGPTVEHRIRHADGSWRHFESTGRTFLSDPDIRGIVVNSRDVTDRKALEAQLLHSQKMEVVGRLAGGVAHEFNNLLTVIRVNTRLLEDRFEAGDLPEEIEEIADAAAGATALTRRLLAFSGRDILNPRPLNLVRLIRDLEDFLRRDLGGNVTLELRLPARPVWILADPGQIEQVILNLCDNARDAVADGGRVVLEARTARPGELPPQIRRPGDWALLRVSDTGPGIPDEIRDRIFDPFFTTKLNGTGLGLATVRGIVSRLGGVVEVDNRTDEGTTFTVCFPRSEERSPGAVPEAGEAPDFPGGRTLLVVDPDPATRSMIQRLLSPGGYRILEAEDGVSALTLVEAYGGPLDLLITGVEMKPIDGEALAARVLMRHPDAGVLFLAGEEATPPGWPGLSRDALSRDLATAVEEVLGREGEVEDGGGISA